MKLSKGRRVWRGGGFAAAGSVLRGMLVLLALTGPLRSEEKNLFNDEGYRQQDYRAPVPAEAPGARTVSLDELRGLRAGGAVLIDVTGLQRFHIGEDGVWIAPGVHQSIPGATWLPVVGWGELEPWQEEYLRQSLADLTGGDQGQPLVVFCKTDCWLSWNAAQRIVGLGYPTVHWFPGGSDDWAAAGLELVALSPYPLHSGPDRPFAP